MIRLSFLLILSACISTQPNNKVTRSGEANTSPDLIPTPHLIIYKTSSDFADRVPVILSPDKKSIQSYPHPKDLLNTEPIQLHDGWLLDRRGINTNVAFLSITYSNYKNLPQTLSRDSLLTLIINSDPIKELCDCGIKSQFTDPKNQINSIIDSNLIHKKCTKIK